MRLPKRKLVGLVGWLGVDQEFVAKKQEILDNHELELKAERQKIKDIENLDLDDYTPSKMQHEDPHLSELMDNIYSLKLRLQNSFEDQLSSLQQDFEAQKSKGEEKLTQKTAAKVQTLKEEYSKKLNRDRERREKELKSLLRKFEELGMITGLKI